MIGRRPHQHAHEALAIYHQATGMTAIFGPTVPAATVVLWRCSCRHADATTLAGRWTLGQIRGEIPAESAAAADLRPGASGPTRGSLPVCTVSYAHDAGVCNGYHLDASDL